MQQTPPARAVSTPSFYLTGRQPLHPGVVLLAIAVALGSLCLMIYAMSHAKRFRMHEAPSSASAGGSQSGAGDTSDDDDDPNQIDTIVLGDPGEAPVPARHGNHVSSVHPTILVVLPRSGDQVGLIPDTPAGRLLRGWLVAFNQANSDELADALPTAGRAPALASEMELRRQTGGFYLLSAKEVQPGLLVFRLQAQAPPSLEALGTLQLRDDTFLPEMASFSLRAIDPPAAP